MMLKGLDFCLHTKTNEEGLHKNFHKLGSTHLAKSFYEGTVCKKGCVTLDVYVGGQELTREEKDVSG